MAIPVICTPYWEYVTPNGMLEPTERVAYTHDGLDFTIWAWKQYAQVTDGAETAWIKIRDTAGAGQYPIDILGEVTVTRELTEAIFPLGALWKYRVVWANGTQDSGNLLMFLAKTGYLNTYYTDAPASRAFYIDGTNNWANPSANIYTLGNIRVRVVKGIPALAGTRITVTRDGDNKVQVMIYNRSAFDSYTLNEMGNTTTTVTNEISQVAGYYKENHMRVVDSDMGIDRYMAINPINSEPKGLLVKLYRTAGVHCMYFGVTDANLNNQMVFSRRLCKLDRGGGNIAAARHYTYQTQPDEATPRFRSQTFNYYSVIHGASWSFWSADRLLDILTFKYYKTDPAEILLLYFKENHGDYKESDAAKDDVTETRTVWVISGYKLIEGVKIKNIPAFDVKGKAGNSIDGGFRHLLSNIAAAGDIKYRNGGAWTHIANMAGGWNYQTAEAAWAISPDSAIRYFTMFRHWDGVWAGKGDLTPWFGQVNRAYVSLMKDVSDPDDLGANTIQNISQCVDFEASGSIPSDAEGNTLISEYTIPGGVAFINGLIDLAAGVPDTNRDWDVGYDGDEDPQIFFMWTLATVTTGDATNVGSTTATGNGDITNVGDGNVDQRGCEWGLVSGGPYPNEVVESNGFGIGVFTCNLTGLPCNTIIYYRAKAHNTAGWSYGVEKSFITDCCVVNCVNYGIRVKWTDNADNEVNYYVERDDGGWHLIATLPANTTEYLDTNITCDMAYLYRVRAGNAYGYSPYDTMTNPVTCPCYITPTVEKAKQYITDAITEWFYDYDFKYEASEMIRAEIISRLEETEVKKHITCRIATNFAETKPIKGKVALEKFEEAKSIITRQFIVKFAESQPIIGALIKRFKEKQIPIFAVVFLWFTEKQPIFAETKSVEDDIIEILRREEERDDIEWHG